MRGAFKRRLGFVPGAIAVMGKWEPYLPMSRCLEEVGARAAAALAMGEALQPGGPGPLLLSVEGKLRGQPRPGCQLCAEVLVSLGATPGRILCWPYANRTVPEVRALDLLRRREGAGGLLLVTSEYHVERTRQIISQRRPPLEQIEVIDFDDSLVSRCLDQLTAARREELQRAMVRGRRQGASLLPLAINEAIARLGRMAPRAERWLADVVRGKVVATEADIFSPGGKP